MREGFLKVFMMYRYILNKCEDMVFDTLTHEEIFPDKICLLLNAKPMEVQKLFGSVSIPEKNFEELNIEEFRIIMEAVKKRTERRKKELEINKEAK